MERILLFLKGPRVSGLCEELRWKVRHRVVAIALELPVWPPAEDMKQRVPQITTGRRPRRKSTKDCGCF